MIAARVARRAEALLAHRLAQLVVPRSTCRPSPSRTAACPSLKRGGGLVTSVDVDLIGGDLLVRLDGRGVDSSPCASLPYTASQPGDTSTLPSVLNGSPSTRVMRVVTRCSAAGKNTREEPAHDQVVELRLGVVQALRPHERRDDREVVGDLRVVEDALVRAHPLLPDDLAREAAEGVGFRQLLQRRLHGAEVVLGSARESVRGYVSTLCFS